MTSLRLRLFALIAAATVIVWSMAAVWTTISAQHDIERVLDRRLRESAHMVASLGSVAVAAPIPKLPIAPTADFERQLSCQIWSVRGALLGRSSSAPSQPMAGRAPGFSERVINGVAWRVYTYVAPGSGLRVMVGDTLQMRRRLVADLMIGLIVPAVLGLLALGALIWIGTGRGLAPLGRVARAVEAREPDDLSPISVRDVPSELVAITAAIDTLLNRLDRLRDSERHFLASAAHELQTPLAGLKTQADIARRSDDPAIRANALQKIETSVDRTARLVRQLLDLARQEAIDAPAAPAPLMLARALAVVRDQLAPLLAARHSTLMIDASIGDVMLAVDEEAMLVALRNLVENAAIYGPEGQRVTASFALTGGEARVMIDDQGRGLSDADAATLRKRFVRGKRETATGSGLGLSIADAALTRIGARLCFAVRETGGTRATIVLPKSAAASAI